jgi:hypothetical protein
MLHCRTGVELQSTGLFAPSEAARRIGADATTQRQVARPSPGSGVAAPSSRTESPERLREGTQPCSSESLPVVKTSECAHDPENNLRIERMTPDSQRKNRLHQWHFCAITLCRYFPGGGRSGQPGNPGAHSGIGLVAVADWWLGRNPHGRVRDRSCGDADKDNREARKGG